MSVAGGLIKTSVSDQDRTATMTIDAHTVQGGIMDSTTAEKRLNKQQRKSTGDQKATSPKHERK